MLTPFGNSNSAQPFPPQAPTTLLQLSSPPSNPQPGFVYFDTTLGYAQVYGIDLNWHGVLTQ